MTAVLAERAAEVMSAAQELLTRRLGAPIALADPVELGGSDRTVVLRVRVVGNPFSLPRTLIVKQVVRSYTDPARHEPGVADADSTFLREAVSYRFATALARSHRPGPDLLAHDLDARLLILSDLGENNRLTHVLRTGDPRTVGNVLMAYAQALGRLHAATVGRERDFTALLRRAQGAVRASAGGLTAEAVAATTAVPGQLRRWLRLGVPDPVMHAVTDAMLLFDDGRFRAFSPSDLCPENIIVNEDGVRFLDYEWGGFRAATLDITHALVPFPGCLCDYRLAPERAQAMVEAWRAEVVGAWPDLADDDVLRRELLRARLAWVWLSTYWLLSADDVRVAEVREHPLSVPRTTALIERWSTLATEASRVGELALAGFAVSVVEAVTTL